MLNFVGGAGEGLKLVSKRKVKTTPEGEALLAGAYCVSKKSYSALVSLGPCDISTRILCKLDKTSWTYNSKEKIM